ncbi:hypothetical protein WA026_005065 [Henosepilachna vigintioctopunctata]|uniref:G-protein coupled receptors family 1 profile domain-containing protein n=1 Tax=Henosepilachna vigintioctopunctata TaxID=420089 RepID=A0AAW1UKH9_9CUCU
MVVMHNRSQYLLDQVNNEVFKNGTISGDISNRSNLLYQVLISSFGAIISITNLAALISSCASLRRDKDGKCVYILLGNMALAALINGIIIIFVQVFPVNMRNHQLCSWQIGQVLSDALISIYCIGVMAIERYLYIIYGLQYGRRRHLFKLQALLSLIWILGISIGYLPLMGWSGDSKNGQECWFVTVAPKNLIFIAIIFFTLPLLTVMLLYAIISYNALKTIVKPHLSLNSSHKSQDNNISRLRAFKNKTTQLPNTDDKQFSFVSRIFLMSFSKNVNTTKRWKAVKVVIFPTTSFFLSWYLYIIVSLYYVTACEDISTKRCKSLMLILASPLSVLAFVNSLLHPILYAWWHKGFNHVFKKRVGTVRSKNSRQNTDIVRSVYQQTNILQKSSDKATKV